MEANWMKNIPSETICNFFYFFFVLYAILAVVTLLGTVGIFALLRMPKTFMIATGFQSLVVFVLAGTSALFYYLICERALLAPKASDAPKEMNGPRMM